MKVNKKLETDNNRIVFGGLSQKFPEGKIEIGVSREQKIYIDSSVFTNYRLNKFLELKKLLDDKGFNKIISEGGYSKMKIESLGYSKFCKEMPLEYIIVENKLIVFTYGEKQPMLWVLILEGIWEIDFFDIDEIKNRSAKSPDFEAHIKRKDK